MISSVLSFIISIIAILATLITIRRGNKNASASMLVSLNEAFAQAWRRVLNTDDPGLRVHELAELMNIMEVYCAISLDGSLVGRTKSLLNEYTKDNFNILDTHQHIRAEIDSLQSSSDTFSNIKEYKIKNNIPN